MTVTARFGTASAVHKTTNYGKIKDLANRPSSPSFLSSFLLRTVEKKTGLNSPEKLRPYHRPPLNCVFVRRAPTAGLKSHGMKTLVKASRDSLLPVNYEYTFIE